MQPIVPTRAPVRPRVTTRENGDSRPLEDVIQELAEDGCRELVWIVGESGCGKSTALAHLAAVIADDDRLVYYDEPKSFGIGVHDASQLVVATSITSAARNGVVLVLQPWGMDELVEYLLAVYPQECNSVINRLGREARQSWSPQVANIVLNRLAQDSSLADPAHALVEEIHDRFPKQKQFSAAAYACLTMLVGGSEPIATAARLTAKTGSSPETLRLLRHSSIQLSLAAESLMTALDSRRTYKALTRRLPFELIELVGRSCREQPSVLRRIEKLLESTRTDKAHPMAGSIMVQADSVWRPVPRRTGRWNLAGGYFPRVKWPVLDLSGAKLACCDFSGADLKTSVLYEADVTGTFFNSADLTGASLKRIHGPSANFFVTCLRDSDLSHANMRRAEFMDSNLSGSDLTRADLSGAILKSTEARNAILKEAILTGTFLEDCDFTGANFSNADLSRIDLRSNQLTGTSFERANLRQAQMEDIHITQARFAEAKLCSAHLTGSKFPDADFRKADLTGAFLAEIEWERANLRGADLRGATFHMGSSRSGLVGSPIAREGSMTGFYTDEREEMYFKRPEEIRKANLCGADLRGAKIEGVDFYLVDLRGSKFDPQHELQIRSTGAILSNE
ncbi:pentapeptide repeat-containing protein [Bythopirellula polymerisocia]|uniref:Secreted effector protein pipB2 n=1 Tax=Bythopirellula polymerisocia TaxID=2528003 RepID=A0A5C6CWV8_9BACT|nr:pentapeptide repeat-containing protein [Bythopirellula polymerisocia]TWU27496.1 Secreted effector protein pipB2 [Bythopirellula polymerisocia]